MSVVETPVGPFAAKNERRKEGRSNGTAKERVEARRLRRELHGMFGNASPTNWNTLIAGTTGARR